MHFMRHYVETAGLRPHKAMKMCRTGAARGSTVQAVSGLADRSFVYVSSGSFGKVRHAAYHNKQKFAIARRQGKRCCSDASKDVTDNAGGRQTSEVGVELTDRGASRAQAEDCRQIASCSAGRSAVVKSFLLAGWLRLDSWQRPPPAGAAHVKRLSLAGPRAEHTLPLQLRDGVYCLVYSIDGSYFRGVVDTGSPFLTVAKDQCREWGCWRGEGDKTSLQDTYERYATQEGHVQWRSADVSFSQLEEQPRHCLSPGGRTIFGVFQSVVGRGGRGDQSLVGLCKNTAPGIRPSLLGQTPYRSFRLDCKHGELTLSVASLVKPGKVTIPLMDFRHTGALAQQYIARVRNLQVNGRDVRASKPIYAMLDSGSSGMFMSDELFYPVQEETRGWRTCEVALAGRGGQSYTLSAGRSSPLFLCFPTRFPWFHSTDGYLVILGMAFLTGHAMTVDMDASLMQIDEVTP